MARILNIIIVILEILGFYKALQGRKLRQLLQYYTQLSNFITLIASVLLVIFGTTGWVQVLRYLSTCMLVMTFGVTVFVLVPMSRRPKELLFSGSGLFQHLLVPILSTFSYLCVETHAPFDWFWLPGLVTMVYGLIMIYLNYAGRVRGPYHFFRVKKKGWKVTWAWLLGLFAIVILLSYLIALI